jgi:hypothetical protein
MDGSSAPMGPLLPERDHQEGRYAAVSVGPIDAVDRLCTSRETSVGDLEPLSEVHYGVLTVLMDEAALSARLIADHLGHSRPSMTQDVYLARRSVGSQTALPRSRGKRFAAYRRQRWQKDG